jgi:hypothetical protein
MDTPTALAILTDALDRCSNEDMRTPDVFAALEQAILKSMSSEKGQERLMRRPDNVEIFSVHTTSTQ